MKHHIDRLRRRLISFQKVLEASFIETFRRRGFTYFGTRLGLSRVTKCCVVLSLAEYCLPNAHRLEFHLVACERASLVCKDIVQLAKVLNDAHVLDLAS